MLYTNQNAGKYWAAKQVRKWKDKAAGVAHFASMAESFTGEVR